VYVPLEPEPPEPEPPEPEPPEPEPPELEPPELEPPDELEPPELEPPVELEPPDDEDVCPEELLVPEGLLLVLVGDPGALQALSSAAAARAAITAVVRAGRSHPDVRNMAMTGAPQTCLR